MSPPTLGSLLEQARARLAAPPGEGEHPLDSPELDARWLVAHFAGLPPGELGVRRDQPASAELRSSLEAALQRRRGGTPLAHILGEWEFWSLPLHVTADVLVPRPETELLVEWGLSLLEGRAAPRIADLGTGSGCIAVALASERPDAVVHAVDISAEALRVAARNLDRHGLSARVTLHEGDLLSPLAGEPPFDLILSNPPYIPVGDPRLAPDVAIHEPALALHDDSPDGLGFYRRLVADAPAHLGEGGSLLVELPEDGARPVTAMVRATGGRAEVRRDLAGIERALRASVGAERME